MRELFVALLAFLLAGSRLGVAEAPSTAAMNGFHAYAASVEQRLEHQHSSPASFLASPSPNAEARLQRREVIVEDLISGSNRDLPKAMLHHWRGTAFVPGATTAKFEDLLRDFGAYPKVFGPQILNARVDSRDGNRMRATMRIRQKHVLTVVMDATYDVSFASLDARHHSSTSRSTGIREIDSPGTSQEHPLDPAHEHGFLWTMNTYWSWEERDGGLFIQIESISLTRSIPTGLGWAVGPFVQSIPRESLEFTLRSASSALKR